MPSQSVAPARRLDLTRTRAEVGTDPGLDAAQHSAAVVTGALLVLVMGLSLAFVTVVLFSVLRGVDEVLAIGYLIVRGALETACYVILAIGWLLLAPLGEAMSAGPGTASPAGMRLGGPCDRL